MLFSRQFRALVRIAALYGVLWGCIGVAVAVLGWNSDRLNAGLSSYPLSFSRWLIVHALTYGAIGVISGTLSSLIIARVERGRLIEQLSIGRTALWCGLAGLTPLLAFLMLNAGLGHAEWSVGSIALLGGLSAAISATSGAVMLSASKRARIDAAPEPDKLSAT